MVFLALKNVFSKALKSVFSFEKWSKSLLDRFSPPDEKGPPFIKISYSVAGRGDSPLTPLNAIWKILEYFTYESQGA